MATSRGASATHPSTQTSQPGKASVIRPPLRRASERLRICGLQLLSSRSTRSLAKFSSAITTLALEEGFGHIRAANERARKDGIEAERFAVFTVRREGVRMDVFDDGEVAPRRLQVLAD